VYGFGAIKEGQGDFFYLETVAYL
jgi:hypothetical protein